MPRIVYGKKGGRVAGTASYYTNTISLNPTMLMQNVEAFIDRTPLHELAHIIDHHINPQNHERGVYITNSGGLAREKRDVHGIDWQRVAIVCGLKDPTRCHNYDTTGLKRQTVNVRQYQYSCPCGCNKTYTVGLKIHRQLQANPDSRFHRRGVRLIYKGIKGEVVSPVVKALQDTAVVKSQDMQGNKIEQCWTIYKRNVGSSRGAIIQTFVSMVGCTPAGAATYYATCKKRYEAGVL